VNDAAGAVELMRRHKAVLKPWSCHAVPRFRIRLPPAQSLRTIGSSAAEGSKFTKPPMPHTSSVIE
jgi:hypothetical protein